MTNLSKNGGEYQTFENYCKGVWSLERRRAYQFIDSAKVFENVKNFTHTPMVESHTKPLLNLEPQQQKEVWQKAVETAPEGNY